MEKVSKTWGDHNTFYSNFEGLHFSNDKDWDEFTVTARSTRGITSFKLEVILNGRVYKSYDFKLQEGQAREFKVPVEQASVDFQVTGNIQNNDLWDNGVKGCSGSVIVEGSYYPEEEEEEEEDSESLDDKTVSINIFFDGTGNNGLNVDELHTHQTHAGKGDSYDSSYTNIYRLYKNLKKNEKTFKLYVEGIGTTAEAQDSSLVQALGDVTICEDLVEIYYKLDLDLNLPNLTFDEKLVQFIPSLKPFTNLMIKGSYIKDLYEILGSGARSRLLALDKEVNEIIKGKNIEKIKFNIFGFSRGATLARCYANQLKFKSFGNQNIENVIDFLGLFDTVESITYTNAFPSHSPKTKFDVKIFDTAKFCYHLTANHEIRENFPLTSAIDFSNKKNTCDESDIFWNHVKTSPERKIVEIYLPGAHADIGGGYLHNLQQNQSLSEYHNKSNLEKELKKYITNEKSSWYPIFKDNVNIVSHQTHSEFLKTAISIGSYLPWGIAAGLVYNYTPLKSFVENQIDSNTLYILSKRKVDGRLQYAYLYMMAEAAQAKGCSFNLKKLKYNYRREYKALDSYMNTLKLINEKAMTRDFDKSQDAVKNIMSSIANMIHISFNYDSLLNSHSDSKNVDTSDAISFRSTMSKDSEIVLGSPMTDDQKSTKKKSNSLRIDRINRPTEDWKREIRYSIFAGEDEI
ncbi:MAG: DUF2235 domain-containing protein [Kurthia sp.]|nr:DUF2235 domain-containing protein [Candidatus Kurthia equi]